MISAGETVETPRVVPAVRLGVFVLFVVCTSVVALVSGDTRPWLYGGVVVLAILCGVLSVIFHALQLVNGAYVDKAETNANFASSSASNDNSDFGNSGGWEGGSGGE